MGKSIQRESRFMVTGGLSGGVGVGRGGWGATSNEYELPFRKDETFRNQIMVMVAQPGERMKKTLNRRL